MLGSHGSTDRFHITVLTAARTHVNKPKTTGRARSVPSVRYVSLQKMKNQ